MIRTLKGLLLSGCLLPTALLAATHYVDGTTGSDANSGMSSATAKKTVQAAIDGASSGDLVLVAAGTYAEHLVLTNKTIELRTVGVLDVTIDGTQTGHCLKIDSGCDGTVIDGFIFCNGAPTNSGNRYGGGIECRSDATIRNCVFKDNGNDRQHFSGGLQVGRIDRMALSVTVYNCLFYGNSCFACGGAVLCEGNGFFDRCTFYGNSCSSWNKIGGVGVASGGTATIKNSILNNNDVQQIGSYSGGGRGTYTVTYSCVSGGASGTGNISSDPQFAETNSLFGLAEGSPCRDAGDPSDLDPDGTRADMGFSAGRIRRATSLSVALDNSDLLFTSGGDADWFGQSEVSHSGGSAAQSGSIGDNQSSSLTTTVTGAGTLTFWWKVSSESNYDKLSVSLDGTGQATISGEQGWRQTTITVTGDGEHTIVWKYSKDVSVSNGSDCGWVDQVVWAAHEDEPPIPCVRVTDVTAQQRYPKDGKVDIAVTLTGTADDVENAELYFFATNTATGAALPTAHLTPNGAASGSGTNWTRTFVWDATADVGTVTIDDIALTVRVGAFGGVQLWENGPYWAECNVGATKPEEYGYYFWWGDTVGYCREGDRWDAVDGSCTGFTFDSRNCPTTGKDNAALKDSGYIDDSGNLAPEHDAATAHLGASWRMPTAAEFEALIGNCTTTWTNRNGVSGRLVTGKGAYALRSIFLPAAGHGYGSDLDDLGTYGDYWSSTSGPGGSDDAWSLDFESVNLRRYSADDRYDSQSVRPLREFAGASSAMMTHFAFDGGASGVDSPITYENLKGATNPNPATYTEGTALTFVSPTSAVAGYTFAGWMPAAITADMTGPQTVRANWTANRYQIVYFANGGTGEMDATACTYDAECEVAANGFVREGYIFKGWATEEVGAVVYAPGARVTNLTAAAGGSVTLYAVWEAEPLVITSVTATDGTSSNEVVVTWLPDTNSAISVTHYEVRRAPKGTDAWTVLASDIDPTMTRFADATARPGIDYDYQVRVGNAGGWSAAAGDTGWRAISLSLDETSWSPSAGATNRAVAVTSNADWTISDATGEASVTANADGIDVSLAENESTDGRTGTVTVTAGGGTDHPVRETFTYAQAGRPIPLPVAVDAEDWIFETGASAGGAAWYGQPKVSHDGVDAARSGRLTGAGATWFETTVTNAGDIAFFWKTSCEPTYDGLSFSIDGETKARLSGVADAWKELSFEIPAGTHVLRWTYSKDGKNDAGEDCGWVDQVTWTPLAAPAWDATDAEGAVRASDGTSSDHVSVTWSPFASGRPVIEYELARTERGGAAWEVLTTANVLSFVDATARPGVDYTYWVRARNAVVWSAPAADDCWRAYALAVGASELAFSSSAGAADLAVTANADWTVAADADWIAVAAASGAAGDADAATVSVTANEAMTARADAVTVTAGTGAHAVSAEVRVVQSARPPQIDVGFAAPFEDWRTRLQVVTNTTAGDVYAPVSVLLAGDPMSVSFGWTNRSEVAVGVPDVLFKVLDAEGVCVSEWTAKGRPGETLAVGASTWSSGWPFGVLRVLQPGDYLLRAELAPAPTYADVDRSDNVAVFRFAVRDPSVTLADDVFADPQWRDPAAKAGNDFAQPPHAAAADCLQFGPYVPMNGVVGRSSNGKQPLDLIFLVDVTGSMGGCIDALKRNIRQFFDALVTGEDRVTDWRAKVVAYRDITCDSPWYQDWGFTTDPDAMRDEIARCYASGGGDLPESLLDAVYRISTETDFREGAARAVLAFTDAAYKSPMSYGAAAGADWEKAAQVARDAEVVLKLIASPWYDEGKSELRTFAESCFSTNSEYIGVSSLSSAALNEDMLRQLAKSVSKSVKTTVVEPSLSVSTRGKGTLSFEWKNDSTAGTNNVFRFSCDDGEGHTNLVNAAGTDWQRVSLDLETGWHLFKWSYGKTDYDGSIVDCGKVRNLAWTPYQTELSLAPTFTEVGHEGARDAENLADGRAVSAVGDGNRKVTVTCNAAWKVVDETVPDWIRIVAGAGDGNGEIWYQVKTNALHVSRSATITVRAGDYGLETDLILEKTFKVTQKASPYVENGAIQILTVDVKPRWPWNDIIDIDFRVLTPAKEGTPVKVSLVGVNEEGGEMLQYYPALMKAKEVAPRETQLESPQGLEVGKDFVVCPTSGLYRVTWTDMDVAWQRKYGYGSIGGTAGWLENGFHTPAFSVRLTGACDGVASVELPSDPVRVDLRQNPVSKTSTHSTTEHSGGAILTGTERIGHPTGAVDPVAVDTTDAALFPSNGWNRLDDLVKDLGPALYSNRFDRACVINDAAVEGGLIVTDTVWRADRVHVVRDNVFVHKDATLTIEDGAVVKFCFNTYLFVYRYPDKSGAEEFNLRMKGCYLTGGYDASYGGNTLYYGGTITEEEKKAWDGANIPILANAKSGDALEKQVTGSATKAATRVYLYYSKIDATGAWTQGKLKTRVYSRGQRWGVLPRPSEAGLEFYGWYGGEPSQYLGISPSKDKYLSKKNMISVDGIPFDDYRDKTIYALMCPTNWAESAWDLVDASGAQVVLADASVVYDGQAHRPSVARVLVNDVLIDPANYEVTYPEGDCTAVGDYAVSVSFLSDYTGTPSTTFRILPRPTDGGAVVAEPASRMYLPAALGGSAKPAVSVTIPGMASVPSGDYAVTWPDAEGRWPRIGVYTIVATFNGNYTGPALTNTFEITVNPDYVYTEHGTKEEAVAKADGRRILYIGGREDDAMTRHVKDLIRNDTDLNEWVIANFSCWADAVESVADLKFADGLATVETPLLAVLGERDDTDFVARHAGYFADAAELKAFLAAALEAEEVVDASAADVTLARTSAAWTGRVQKPTVTAVTLRGETLAEGTDYTVGYGEGDWTAVGAYAVKVTFCGVYRGETAARTFEIVPAALEADAVALDPVSAAYDGTAKRPSVTSVAGVELAVDYGTGGYVEVGDYDVRVTATGCATGTVTKTFSVTAQPVGVGEAVEIVLDVTGAEIRRGKPPAEPLRPNVLAVRQGGKTFVAGVDYDVDYGDGDYLSAGTNTITVTFKGRYSGTASVTFEIVETSDAVVTVEGDEGAEVIADPSDPDRTLVRPSEGNTSVVVIIPEGIDAAKVTVEVSTAVVRVTPNGATVRIVSGGTDITGLLVLPEADAEGRIDLTAARVVDAVVREVLNPGVSADNVVRWEDGRLFLQTVTRRGLRYVLYEGERLDALRAGDSTTGDGGPWRPRLSVYGGASGFYSIRVGK